MRSSSRSSTSSSRRPELLFQWFEQYAEESKRLCGVGLPLPAYDYCMKCSHAFNLLDARGAISVAERAQYIKRVRDLALLCAQTWVGERRMSTLFVEVRSEELPARFVSLAAEELEKRLCAAIAGSTPGRPSDGRRRGGSPWPSTTCSRRRPRKSS